MALTLLRHATLPPQHAHRYNGWTDIHIDPVLFDAKEVALLTQQKFDLIYASDLLRCPQTLELMGITEYITDERLREIRFKKEVEGLNFNEIEKLNSYKARYIEERDTWHAYICDESQTQFESRIKDFLETLPLEKEILICSHGGTLQKIMAILGYAKNKIAYLEYIRIDNVKL